MNGFQIKPGWFLLFVTFLATAFYFLGFYFSPHLSIEFKDSWTDKAQTVIQAFGLLSLFFFWLERINSNKWNRLRETLNLTWTTPYSRLLEGIRGLEDRRVFCRKWGAMEQRELGNLKEDEDAKRQVRNFLDHLEEISAGQKLRVFDDTFFDSIWSSILKKNFRFFEPFITDLRIELEQSDLYADLEEVVVCLEDKHMKTKAKRSK